MRRYTTIKVIAAFILSAAIVISAYLMTSKSLKELVAVVRNSANPDLVLIKVKEINNSSSAAESDVRSFMLTQDEKYIDSYQKVITDINRQSDSLNNLASGKPYLTSAVDSLAPLIGQKIKIYDQLLGISYNRVLQSALGKITEQIPDEDSMFIDTLKIPEEKKSFLKRLFSSPSRIALKEKADSAFRESEKSKKQISDFQKTIAGIRQMESKQLLEQTEKELALLQKDKRIKFEIENRILKIEFLESYHAKAEAEEANASAEESVNFIRLFIAGGTGLLLLLIILILLDITKNNLLSKQLAGAKLQAEKLAKIKEEFLATMSHEIRTPLSSVFGYAERLQKTKLSERQLGYVNAITASSEHLLSIVNDILDLTKIETGNLNFEKIDFSPSLIIKEVCGALKLKADEKSLELVFDISKIDGLIVKGDPLRLKQVLFNLVGNAIKFTEKGEVRVEVSCSKPQINSSPDILPVSSFEFRVTDTGIGIPAEKIKTIFNQFEQVETGTSRQYGGTGLGLSISKKIIEKQEGSIHVKSTLLKGSEFIFVIPYPVSRMEGAKINKAKFTHEAGEKRSLSGIRILLAEDTEVNRVLQAEILNELGAAVVTVDNGEKAIAELTAKQFDVILLDIQMPVMNGMDTVKEIIKKYKLNAPPVIAMTANVMQQDIAHYLSAGFTDIITKPFKERELSDKINHVLSRSDRVSFLPEAAKASQKAGQKAYDLDDLIITSGGNHEFVIRMLRIFLKSFESILKKAQSNAEDKNWDALSANVHRLIPSCRQLSIDLIAQKLKLIEDMCNSNPDEIKIIQLIKEISEDFEKISKALKKEIEKIKSLQKTNPV